MPLFQHIFLRELAANTAIVRISSLCCVSMFHTKFHIFARQFESDFIDITMRDSIHGCVLVVCNSIRWAVCWFLFRFFFFYFHLALLLLFDVIFIAFMCVWYTLCNKNACNTYCTYGYQFNLTSGARSLSLTQNNSGKMISFMNNLQTVRLYAQSASMIVSMRGPSTHIHIHFDRNV